MPAGGALAVDRDKFGQAITEAVENHPLIEVVREEFLPDHLRYLASSFSRRPLNPLLPFSLGL